MAEDQAPNARITDKSLGYTRAGGSLKIRYPVQRGDKWIEFNPANLHVEFNGQRIEMLKELTLTIDEDAVPNLSLKFTLDEVDIDMDTLTALEVFLTKQGQDGT